MSSQDIEMPATSAGEHAPAARRAERAQHGGQSVFHPVVDFLCLGGLSLVILPLMYYAPPHLMPALIGLGFIVSDLINHPHFAHSYQIFYRGYGQKLAGVNLSRGMQARYIFAGIIAPIAMILFFTVALMQPTPTMMAYGANVMLFLVGWHYTKQGYGMLIVDSVFKRKFFDNTSKDIFRYNAYAVWWFSWMLTNRMIAERDLWGLKYYSIEVPDAVLLATGLVAAGTTLASLVAFYRKFRTDPGGLPWTGVMAYVVTLYVWIFGRLVPQVLIFIPAFHSLQYLLIVWRFEINRTASTSAGTVPAWWRVPLFITIGIALGYLGFWLIPRFFDNHADYDHAVFGKTVFLFVFWTFINVHHYVIDNVIWRADNPETRAHLFGPKPA